MKPCATRCRGLSMVEAVMSVMIIGIAMVASLASVGAARSGEQWIDNSRLANTLAQDLLAEISALQYADAADTTTVFGPTAAEAATGNRSLFNDVNDYRNWTESPPLAKDGTTLGFDSTWRRTVVVDFTNTSNPNVSSGTDQGLAVITVKVSRNASHVVSLSTLRSAGLPETEHCTLPDGSQHNLAPAHCVQLGGTSRGPGTNVWTVAESADWGFNLVALWRMDEATGATTADSIGTNHATLVNGPTFAGGQIGNALKLDGVNEHATVAHAAALSLNNSFTLAAWVYVEAFPPSGAWAVVIWKGTTTSTWNYVLELFGKKVQLEFVDTTGNGQGFIGASLPRTRKWYHIAATYDDATDSVGLYVDGVQSGFYTTTKVPATNTNGLLIGKSPFGDYVDGRIDDARIYNRALSEAEISTLYNGGEP